MIEKEKEIAATTAKRQKMGVTTFMNVIFDVHRHKFKISQILDKNNHFELGILEPCNFRKEKKKNWDFEM